MLIPCPHCGERDHGEFAYAGDAGVKRPGADAPFAAWHDYVYQRENRIHAHRELWQHVYGCRSFVVVERDLKSHAIAGAWIAGTEPRES
jgi:sarcosine oxidase subunit delta